MVFSIIFLMKIAVWRHPRWFGSGPWSIHGANVKVLKEPLKMHGQKLVDGWLWWFMVFEASVLVFFTSPLGMMIGPSLGENLEICPSEWWVGCPGSGQIRTTGRSPSLESWWFLWCSSPRMAEVIQGAQSSKEPSLAKDHRKQGIPGIHNYSYGSNSGQV